MKNKKHILAAFHHFIVGFFLTIKGFDKFTHCHHLIGGFIFTFGIIILFYFLYEISAKKQGRTLKLLVHLFEGLALLFTSYIFFEDGKTYLPYITLTASIGFFISVVVIYFKTKQIK
jgi:hypothetical protein